MVVLGGGAVSYERGTPLVLFGNVACGRVVFALACESGPLRAVHLIIFYGLGESVCCPLSLLQPFSFPS